MGLEAEQITYQNFAEQTGIPGDGAVASQHFTYEQFAEKMGTPGFMPDFREETSRIDSAMHVVFDNTAESQQTLSKESMKALFEVYDLEQIGDSQWTLDDLQPSQSIEETRARLQKSKLLPVHDLQFIAFMDLAQQQTPKFWASPEGEKIFEYINELCYQHIATQYPLDNMKRYPSTFYHDNVIEGFHGVSKLVKDEYDGMKDTLSLLNEVVFTTEPAQLVQLVLSQRSSDRLRYELLRSLIFTELSAGKEAQAHDLNKIIDKIQRYINIDLFTEDVQEGSGNLRTYYGFFDKKTNKPLWISTDGKLSKEQYKEYKKTANLKKMTKRMRNFRDIQVELDDDTETTIVLGESMTNPREKPNGTTLEKATRDAGIRELTTGDNFLEVAHLRDLGGIMYVTTEDPDDLAYAIKTVLMERFQLHRNYIKDKNETAQSRLQSKNFSYTRFFAEFPQYNLKSPIEFIIVNLERYARNEMEYGEQDPITQEYLGPAHEMYDERRQRFVGKRWFPRVIYNQDVSSEDFAAKSRGKRREKLEKFDNTKDKLPKEFIEEMDSNLYSRYIKKHIDNVKHLLYKKQKAA